MSAEEWFLSSVIYSDFGIYFKYIQEKLEFILSYQTPQALFFSAFKVVKSESLHKKK